MSRKTLGFIAIAVGIILLAISALADYIGLGVGDPGIGPKQTIGIIVGIVVIVGGLGLSFLSKKN